MGWAALWLMHGLAEIGHQVGFGSFTASGILAGGIASALLVLIVYGINLCDQDSK